MSPNNINLAGTFYYMFSVLGGYSRAIVQWDMGREEAIFQARDVKLEAAREARRQKRDAWIVN